MIGQRNGVAPLRVGLCGMGTVGLQVYQQLSQRREHIAAVAGRPIEVVVYSTRTRRDMDLEWVQSPCELAARGSLDVVVELIGGEDAALDIARVALGVGHHFVTANKALLAAAWPELTELAERAGVGLGIEASVGGGVPMLKMLRDGLAGNQVRRLVGILNGTSNYILSALCTGDIEFAAALVRAQELGYAETDPVLDIDGTDAAQKLVILVALAFGIEVPIDAIPRTDIQRVTHRDTSYAAELGYRIKPLVSAELQDSHLSVRVTPALVPENSVLAQVDGEMNALLVEAVPVGTVISCGPGAGGVSTASAVVADLIDIARGCHEPLGTLAESAVTLLQDASARPFYLRMEVQNRAGVVARISGVLAEYDISLEAILQREGEASATRIPMVVLTHEVAEQQLYQMLQRMNALSDVVEPVLSLPVASLQCGRSA